MAQSEQAVRLLHITTVPESLDFLAGQAGYMRERGIEVHALSSPGPMLEAFGLREGVPVHAVEMPRRICPVSDLRSLGAIRAVIRRVRPRIVHAHTPKGGLLGTLAAWLEAVPVRIYHVHGTPFVTASGPRRALLMASEACASRAATQVLCVSPSVRSLIVERRLCPPSKVKVLGKGSINGVDAEGRFNPGAVGSAARAATRARFAIPDGAYAIGFIGRVVRDKGVVELAAAWQALRQEFADLHMLIVGPFEPQDPVPADVEAALRSDPRVHLAGFDLNTPPLYAAMDMVVLPSHREGFPSVPLEAGAMSLPVVATRVPGCVDAVVDGETGVLVEPRDASALAEAIRCYLRDPELSRRHGQAGRERVLGDYRPDRVWQALYAEYGRLMGEQPDERVVKARGDRSPI